MDIVNDEDKDINTVIKQVGGIDTKVKHKSFGKTKSKPKKAPIVNLMKCDDKELLEKQANIMEREIEKVKEKK